MAPSLHQLPRNNVRFFSPPPMCTERQEYSCPSPPLWFPYWPHQHRSPSWSLDLSPSFYAGFSKALEPPENSAVQVSASASHWFPRFTPNKTRKVLPTTPYKLISLTLASTPLSFPNLFTHLLSLQIQQALRTLGVWRETHILGLLHLVCLLPGYFLLEFCPIVSFYYLHNQNYFLDLPSRYVLTDLWPVPLQ